MYLEQLQHETEEYIRWRSGIDDWQKMVDLWALSGDTSEGIPVMDLAMLAIWGSREKRLTSMQICEALEERFPDDANKRKKSRLVSY